MIKFLTRRSIEWNKKLIVCLYDLEQTTANNNVGLCLLMYLEWWGVGCYNISKMAGIWPRFWFRLKVDCMFKLIVMTNIDVQMY